MQLFYYLTDPAMEEPLYKMKSMRRFAGLPLSYRLPGDRFPYGQTILLNFLHLLERHNLSEKLFREINQYLKGQSLLLREGSTVNASIYSGTDLD